MTDGGTSMAAGGFGRPAQASDGPTNASMQINPALKTYLRNDIMRNGINGKNAMLARMIDGEGGVFDTMANMGMGDMREAQVAYAETSMQGDMLLLHSSNDLARDPGNGNGLMIDAYATPDMSPGGRAAEPEVHSHRSEDPAITQHGLASAAAAGAGATAVSLGAASGTMPPKVSTVERKVATIKGRKVSEAALRMANVSEGSVPEPNARLAILSESADKAATAKLPVEEGETPDPTGHKAPGGNPTFTGHQPSTPQSPGSPTPQLQQGPFVPKDPREKKEAAPPSASAKQESSVSVKLEDVMRQAGGREGFGIASLASGAVYMSSGADEEENEEKRRKKRRQKVLVGNLQLHDNRPEYKDNGPSKKDISLDEILLRVVDMDQDYYNVHVKGVLERRMEMAQDPKRKLMYRALLRKCEDARSADR